MATCWAASWAAKGVDFLAPLKPMPAEAHDNRFPCLSVTLIMVLLKVE